MGGGCPTAGYGGGAALLQGAGRGLQPEGEGARVCGLLVTAAAPQPPAGTGCGAGGGAGYSSFWHLWGGGQVPG